MTLTQAQSAGMPNRPFRIDDPLGVNGSGTVVGPGVITRDLVHRFYSHIMQIGDGSSMRRWKLAQQYTLADNFFMGAFGGSYLNHQYLVCACVPVAPAVDRSPSKDSLTQVDVDAQGRFVRMTPAATMPAPVLAGPPRYLRDAPLTPREADGKAYLVNTMQPPYQPSGNAPAAGGDPRYADTAKPTTLPPQTLATIGDRLDAKGVSWAWYGGAWDASGAGPHLRRQGAIPAAPPAVQLLRAFRSAAAGGAPPQAPARLRHPLPGRRGRRPAAARGVLQAAGQPEPARRLCQPV